MTKEQRQELDKNIRLLENFLCIKNGFTNDVDSEDTVPVIKRELSFAASCIKNIRSIFDLIKIETEGWVVLSKNPPPFEDMWYLVYIYSQRTGRAQFYNGRMLYKNKQWWYSDNVGELSLFGQHPAEYEYSVTHCKLLIDKI